MNILEESRHTNIQLVLTALLEYGRKCVRKTVNLLKIIAMNKRCIVMAYKHVQSGGIWYAVKEENSISGTRHDLIYGESGIGSPHGHSAYFNENTIFNRPIDSLEAIRTGSEFIILRV